MTSQSAGLPPTPLQTSGLNPTTSPQPSPIQTQPYATNSPTPNSTTSTTNPPSSVTVPSILSPPNGVPNWPQRQVSECAFDFLHWELVSYWSKQVAHSMRGEDPKFIAKKLSGKLEGMGFGIGQRYVERYSKDHPFQEQPLDIVKFMCKEFWTLVFKKQIDKLQTNYKGIYVLHDFNFRWIARIFALSPDVDSAALIEQARVYTSLACGIIRGALWNLGLNASVKTDLNKLPAVQFTIVEDKTAAAAAAAQAAAANNAATKLPNTTSAAPINPSTTANATTNLIPPRPGSGTSGQFNPPGNTNTTNRLRTSISASTLAQTTGTPATNPASRPSSGSMSGRA